MGHHHFFLLQCWLRMLYRRGGRYHRHAKTLASTQHYDQEQLEQYQNGLLRKMIRHCYRNVPYYHARFRELGLKPEDIRTAADLENIPPIDKNTVQNHLEEFISRKHYNFLCNTGRTSGSTGRPARFIRDFDSINFEHAIVWRQWSDAGDTGKKRVSLRGEAFIPSSRGCPPFWRYDPTNRELQMSSYHLSKENSRYYIDKILAFRPEILYCGPSMGYILAKFFRMHGVDYRFEAIFTSSESLEDTVREYIESVFHSPVYDWYGQAERVAAIGQCRAGGYHIQEDYSIVELQPMELKPMALKPAEPEYSDTREHDPASAVQDPDGGHICEIVGTQLYNYVMPLLRYRTQDYVHSDPTSPPCACGSSFRRVDRIIGRDYGYLLTPEGYHIAITAHIPCRVENIIETQFYQEKQGEVVVKVVTNGRLSEMERSRLVKDTLKHTSPKMKVYVEEVSNIPRGPNGKFVNIINKIPLSIH